MQERSCNGEQDTALYFFHVTILTASRSLRFLGYVALSKLVRNQMLPFMSMADKNSGSGNLLAAREHQIDHPASAQHPNLIVSLFRFNITFELRISQFSYPEPLHSSVYNVASLQVPCSSAANTGTDGTDPSTSADNPRLRFCLRIRLCDKTFCALRDLSSIQRLSRPHFTVPRTSFAML